MRFLARLLIIFLMAAQAAPAGAFGVAEEKELGRKFNALVRSRLPLVEDPEVTSYVRGMVADLLAVMPPQAFPIETSVLRHNALNAFAAPGGYIFVHTGLILNVEHEADVAGVLAHELAHVSQRHIAERIERQKALSILTVAGMLASIFIGDPQAKQAAIGGAAGLATSAELAYSRENERQADNVGMQYLVDAGWPPEGMLRAFKAIRKLKFIGGGGQIPTYMSTHPGVDERIGYLDDLIGRMPEPIQQRPDQDKRFDRVKMLIRARYTDPSVALRHFTDPAQPSCLDRLGAAIALTRLNRMAEAGPAFDEAFACGGDDPLWLREAGRYQFANGDFDAAAMNLQKAAIRNPSDLMALFFYARLLGQQGRTDKAQEYFIRILRELPEDPEVHYYYARLMGEAGDAFTGRLHLAYASLYQNNPKEARFHRDKAAAAARTSADHKALTAYDAAYDERAQFWKDAGLR